jgi:hypothetical protein
VKWLAGVVMLVAACGEPPIAEHDLFASLRAAVADVELGQAFELEVTRVWRRELVPEAWKDEMLAPLVVAEIGVTRRDDGTRLEERRRFRAHAFALDTVRVELTLRARPRAGGVEKLATAEPLVLRVRSALPAGTLGAPELPGDLLTEPFPWLPWCLGGGAALAALAVVWRRRRAHEPRVEAPQAPAIAADARALEWLRRLRERPCPDRAAVEACYVETSALVRAYLEARFAVPAAEMTTEELLRAEPMERTLAPYRGLLGDLFGRCDLVKFARQVPAEPERQQVLQAAERFVRATRPENGAPA